MGTMTYFVALAFRRSDADDGIVACEPKEARSAEQAVRMAGLMAAMEGHRGAIANWRSGDWRIRRCSGFEDGRRS
jgi:hypothetical protein